MLDTGVRTFKNVDRIRFGSGSLNELTSIIEKRTKNSEEVVVFLDDFFRESKLFKSLSRYKVVIVSTKEEPKTSVIDDIMTHLRSSLSVQPTLIVAIGGGTTMDTAKACSNLFTNEGCAADYQGWDKVKNKGIYKIGIPSISGTGAEATRTCVMTNPLNGLKLGMNSDYTVFDFLILDPNLTKTVNKDQYFFTGMDSYIHCMEALEGQYRNPVGDAFSESTLRICREIFLSEDMMSASNRENLMVASYLGGCSIAMSYVGVVHPFSAGLSVVLGIHHCEANCIVMNAMEEFYPDYFKEFHQMARIQNVSIKKGLAKNLTESQYEALYNATIIHEKPLFNALGADFRDILTKEKVKEVFKKM